MSNHIARDSMTRSKFHIVGLDAETGMVNVLYADDGWISGFQREQQIPMDSFIESLMAGRIEIRPLKPLSP